MPNWCYNNMTVRGSTSDLQAFVESIYVPANEANETKARLSLSSLYPIPAELLEYNAPLSGKKTGVVGAHGIEETAPLTDEEKERVIRDFRMKYGASDWYDWCCSNWGTKWGDCETRLDTDDYEPKSVPQVAENAVAIGVYYETAWSPADGLIAEISRLNPNLLFEVMSTEEAEQFAGWSIFHAGHMVGSGSGEIEPPAEITEKYDEDNIDDYYEALSEWQCERSDKMDTEARKFANEYLAKLTKEREQVERTYRIQMMNLKEQMENALAKYAITQVPCYKQ